MPYLGGEEGAPKRWHELASRIAGRIADAVIDERHSGAAIRALREPPEQPGQRDADCPQQYAPPSHADGGERSC